MRTFTERIDLRCTKDTKAFLEKIKKQKSFKSLNQAFNFLIKNYEISLSRAKKNEEDAKKAIQAELAAKCELKELKDTTKTYLENHAKCNESRVAVYEMIYEKK